MALPGQNVFDALAPLDEAQCAFGTKKLYAASLGEFVFAGETVGINVNQSQASGVFRDDRVGGGDDRLADPQPLGDALREYRFSRAKVAVKRDDGPIRSSLPDRSSDRERTPCVWAGENDQNWTSIAFSPTLYYALRANFSRTREHVDSVHGA